MDLNLSEIAIQQALLSSSSTAFICCDMMKTVTFKINEELLKKLNEYASRHGISRSEAIRKAIMELLNSDNDYSTSTLNNDDLLNLLAVVLSSMKGISIHKARQVILAKAKELITVIPEDQRRKIALAR